jgi:hypothetical protein
MSSDPVAVVERPVAARGLRRLSSALRYRLWLLRNRIGRLRVLLAAPRHGCCAEIGVWKGDFSHRIVQLRHPAELHLVDPWLFASHFPDRCYGGASARSQTDMDAIAQSVARRFAGNPEVVIHRATSLDAVATFSDAYFDWIYIDGDHSYQAVLDDLLAWYAKLRPGGCIALDDYEWRDEDNRTSVRSAINAFLADHAVAQAKLMQGQFLICKP